MSPTQNTLPPPKLVSLRDHVRGAVVELLETEHMSCLQTQEGLVTVTNALAHYTEEGRALFPKVLVFDNLEVVQGMIPGCESVRIGQGPKTPDTMASALKRCAPLARSGWCVFIERASDSFSYGLIRGGRTALSVGLAEILVDAGDPQVPVLLLHQVGANVIEIRGVSHHSLVVNFGATRDNDVSPLPAIYASIDTIARNVPVAVRDAVVTFYQNMMIEVLHAAHGTLAAVIPAKVGRLPSQFSDAVKLDPPIRVSEKIMSLLEHEDSESGLRLTACSSLITGMLLSDGITVFGSDGSVRAYSVFVKHPREKSAEATAGGARHRTYTVLSKMVGRGLAGC